LAKGGESSSKTRVLGMEGGKPVFRRKEKEMSNSTSQSGRQSWFKDKLNLIVGIAVVTLALIIWGQVRESSIAPSSAPTAEEIGRAVSTALGPKLDKLSRKLDGLTPRAPLSPPTAQRRVARPRASRVREVIAAYRKAKEQHEAAVTALEIAEAEYREAKASLKALRARLVSERAEMRNRLEEIEADIAAIDAALSK